MIPPGYVLLGVDAAKYSLAELRSDYRRGLVVAVSFCVFVMPVLLGTRYDHYITYVLHTHVTHFFCRHYIREFYLYEIRFSASLKCLFLVSASIISYNLLKSNQ